MADAGMADAGMLVCTHNQNDDLLLRVCGVEYPTMETIPPTDT